MGKFKHHIFVCGNQRQEGHPRGCCDPQGASELRAEFKRQVKSRGLRSTVRANRAGCLDQCEHGPCLVVYPEGIWYQFVEVDDVTEIIESHILEGHPVKRLLMDETCINNRDCEHREQTRAAFTVEKTSGGNNGN